MSIRAEYVIECDAKHHDPDCPRTLSSPWFTRREIQRLARARGWYVTGKAHLSGKCWTDARVKVLES